MRNNNPSSSRVRINVSNTLKGHEKGVRCVIYLPKIDKIASSSDDQSIRIFDPNDGKHVKTMNDHYGEVWCIINFNEDFFLSCSDDLSILCWNVDSLVPEERVFTNRRKHYLNCLMKLNEEQFLSLDYQCNLQLIEFSTFKLLKKVMAFGTTLYPLIKWGYFVTCDDAEINIWNHDEIKIIKKFSEDCMMYCSFPGSWEYGFQFHATHSFIEKKTQNEILVGGGGTSGTKNVVLWNFELEDINGDVDLETFIMKEEVLCLYVYKNEYLLCFMKKGLVSIFDLEEKKIVKEEKLHDDDIMSVTRISGNIFASASNDKTVKIWKLEVPKDIISVDIDEKERIEYFLNYEQNLYITVRIYGSLTTEILVPLVLLL